MNTWLSRILRRDEVARPRLRLAPRPSPEPFHAVSIKPGLQCCEAARQFGKLRFLSSKAPLLPLPACQSVECTCMYTHFSDRRSGVDRRSLYDFTREQQYSTVNRRAAHGRRSTDAVR